MDRRQFIIGTASLLAATPAIARPSFSIADNGWNEARLEMERRLQSLRNWRLTWWQHWSLLAENIQPRRYHWLITPNSMNRGLPINQSIVDPTATQAVRVCDAGMVNGLMSPSRPWFKLKPAGVGIAVTRDMQLWFDEVEHRLYTIMAGSNFYDSITQMFEDLIVFGTAPMIIYEDREDIIRCYVPCAGEYYLANGADNRINVFNRTFVLTVWQLVQMFGLDNVGPEVQRDWNAKGTSLETEYIVAHAIEPNFSVSMNEQAPKLGVVPGGFAWREVYWLFGRNTNAPLKMTGYHENPGIYPRWATTSNDAYGRSPMMDALPDILQLQVMTKRFAEAIEKMVRPPMQAHVSMKNQPSSILPGQVTYVPDLNQGGFKPVFQLDQFRVQEMAGWIKEIQARIKVWAFNDLFQMMAQLEGVQPRNELEIMERRGEKLQQLGPVNTRLRNEGASPALRRIVGIMKRRGILPPLPASLHGIPIEIEYVGDLELAQRAAGTATMERGLNMAASMDKLFPEAPPTDNIDPDEFWREYADKLGWPNKPIRGTADVIKIRQGRQQAQAQAQQSEEAKQMATHVAPALAGAAKDVSDIDTGGGLNAMQMLLGQGGAAPGATGLLQ